MAAIASTVAIISLLIIVIIVTVAIFSFVKYWQNKRRMEQFDFQSMSYSDVKNATDKEHFTEIEDEKKDLASTWKQGHINFVLCLIKFLKNHFVTPIVNFGFCYQLYTPHLCVPF